MASRFGASRFGASRLVLLVAILLGALLLGAGCARSIMQSAIVAKHGGHSDEAEMDFWGEMAKTRSVTNHDALHAVMLTFHVERTTSDFEVALASAREHGWIAADDALPALETARIGWIAKAICIETGIKGGVTMRLFGARERYAVRELNYRRWINNMTPAQAVSGLQLIALLSEAEDFLIGAPSTNPEDLDR